LAQTSWDKSKSFPRAEDGLVPDVQDVNHIKASQWPVCERASAASSFDYQHQGRVQWREVCDWGKV